MVPDFQSLMRPLLQLAAERSGDLALKDLRAPIAERLALTPADVAERLASGRQTRLQNRMAWAKIHMERAGLLEVAERGRFKVTKRGHEVLAATDERVDMTTLAAFPEYHRWRKADLKASEDGAATLAVTVETLEPVLTPDDMIESGHAALSIALKAELLARIHAEPPAFFERFIRDLLIAMGYGGGVRERGILTGGTGDGGIDGVIHEDALGLDAVYVQAKRYQAGSNVAAHELRGFVGSMTAENAGKGVFVTTSGFTRDATAFVEKVTQRIVLIDGDRLAELALRHGTGVRTQRTIALQRIDEDYFAGDA